MCLCLCVSVSVCAHVHMSARVHAHARALLNRPSRHQSPHRGPRSFSATDRSPHPSAEHTSSGPRTAEADTKPRLCRGRAPGKAASRPLHDSQSSGDRAAREVTGFKRDLAGQRPALQQTATWLPGVPVGPCRTCSYGGTDAPSKAVVPTLSVIPLLLQSPYLGSSRRLGP